MLFGIVLILILLGLAVLLFGNRMWLLGAGIGALLGAGFLQLLPGQQSGLLAFLLIFGLAIVLGIVLLLVKGLANIGALIIGFLAGGAITLGIFDALSISLGFLNFILGLVGGLIGAALVSRFFDWAIVIIASIVGAGLVTRGIQIYLPSLGSTIISIGWIILAVLGFLYQSRGMRSKNKVGA